MTTTCCAPDRLCTPESRCDACAADLAVLVTSPRALPEGWTKSCDPFGADPLFGGDMVVRDERGRLAGTYRCVPDYREDAPADPRPWLAAGRRYPSEDSAIAAVVERHVARRRS